MYSVRMSYYIFKIATKMTVRLKDIFFFVQV